MQLIFDGKPSISIHVLRVEDDARMALTPRLVCRFQSTSSVWRTTKCRYSSAKGQKISIHVLRVEDDSHALASLCRRG